MTSIILQSAIRYLVPIIVLFSLFMLLRGHDEPGGGFIGGLLGATAFALYAIAFDVKSSRQLLRVELHKLLSVGLLLAAGSGLFGIFWGDAYLMAHWMNLTIPPMGEFKVGTPLVFDLGVYLVVVAVTLMIVYSLSEE